MKKLLCGTVAAIAVAAIATPAAAQTNQRHYASAPLGLTATNPSTVPNLQIGPIVIIPSDQAIAEGVVALGLGTRYTAEASAADDTETATRRVNVVFRLSGRVNKDCSFYAGNDNSARDIDFGVIGVRTGNNENVNEAFDMAGPATAEIETLTAGCNFNNEVEIVKSSADGLINNGAGDYDSDEFQANIPYRVTARWTGVEAGSGAAAGEDQELVVGLNEADDSILQGAWRSDMTISFRAPVAAKALVAGRYTGTTRLTLRAL